jgi:hypothetical protein
MRLESRRLIEQVLVSEKPCLGAVFCSYTFDPAYFEERVLRALLRLQGDPEEDGVRYHEEARAALRETPVACFVDARVRRGGRRLPYDLQLVRERTFHPKVILALYDEEARIAVGSGNATKPGFEQNAELFFTRSLRYDIPADAVFLRSVDGFLNACAGLATHPGTQLTLVRKALAARIADTPFPAPDAPMDAVFVHSFGASMLDQLDASIPREARATRVGVLSPFFEQDDLDIAHDTEGLSSVLSRLLALRSSEAPPLDIGVPWDDAPLAPPAAGNLPALEEGTGRLWASRFHESVGGESVERLEYFRVDRVTAKRVEVRSASGRPGRHEREALEQEVSEGRLWPVETPTVHAPRHILQRIAGKHAVDLWLHPTAALNSVGRAHRRPLHAKLFLLAATLGRRPLTYALVGSANASDAALSRGVEERGNVEAGVVLCLDGEVRLHDMLPTLVSSAFEAVRFEEREMPPADVDFSAWIEDVVHDADARTLTVTWSQEGPPGLGAWSWFYLERELAKGVGPGTGPVVLTEFELAAAGAELEFRAAGRKWLVPIRVADLAMLPTSPQLAGLGVRELLALLGRRVGHERLSTLREQRGAGGVDSVLDTVFGEGFGPTDVFKAWWGLKEDLVAAPTVSAFRYRLLGPTGARTLWGRLRDLPRDTVSDDEIWVYGCELLRELEQLVLSESADREAKQELLAELRTLLRGDLSRLMPPGAGPAWLDTVVRFYRIEGTHGKA